MKYLKLNLKEAPNLQRHEFLSKFVHVNNTNKAKLLALLGLLLQEAHRVNLNVDHPQNTKKSK